MSDDLAAMYAPFVAALRAGTFRTADSGWPPELIGAHVALNNDLIAELAERVAAGEAPAYDNAAAVDDDALRQFAETAGGRQGMAEAVERSAMRLAAACGALGERAGTLVPVVIRDGGAVVVDQAVPIGSFCEGNAGFHLAAHREQLRALEDPPAIVPPSDFDQFQVVLLVRSPDAPEMSETETAELMRHHLGHFAKMQAAGWLHAAGPLRGDDVPPMAGICIYQTSSEEMTRRLAEDDPAVRGGHFVVQVFTWYTPKGTVSFLQ
ncbi:MAG: YciI family protein [Acidimicrobiales bacterium]|jgi:uncharacterized protein YciI